MQFDQAIILRSSTLEESSGPNRRGFCYHTKKHQAMAPMKRQCSEIEDNDHYEPITTYPQVKKARIHTTSLNARSALIRAGPAVSQQVLIPAIPTILPLRMMTTMTMSISAVFFHETKFLSSHFFLSTNFFLSSNAFLTSIS